jgi:hypothetical protein
MSVESENASAFSWVYWVFAAVIWAEAVVIVGLINFIVNRP